MRKNRLLLLIGLIILIFAILFIIYHFTFKKTYSLDLPNVDNIETINLEYNEKSKTITNELEIEDIIYVLSGGKDRVSNQTSINDSPVDANELIKIKLNTYNNKVSTLFVYTKNNKYYIEKPYNCICRISADEYNGVFKYIR